MASREQWIRNHNASGGIYDGDLYYEYHQACIKAEEDFGNATYSSSTKT